MLQKNETKQSNVVKEKKTLEKLNFCTELIFVLCHIW
jgi:hypothetical protein